MRSVHVAFLRGVNVGGRHSLPMRTCIQSGNVLFTAGTALARQRRWVGSAVVWEP